MNNIQYVVLGLQINSQPEEHLLFTKDPTSQTIRFFKTFLGEFEILLYSFIALLSLEEET